MSPEKQKLVELAKTGKCLFHGSGDNLEILEPRQAHNIINREKMPDGEPAIFASPSIDYAILMAIINDKNCPKNYSGIRARAGGVGSEKNTGLYKFKFGVNKKAMERLTDNSSGWVYVFDKSLFKQRHAGEYISYKPVSPLEKIHVKKQDLPEDIEIFEDWDYNSKKA